MVSVSVADELAIALKASREALAEKDAELSRTRREFSGSEAKRAKLAAELEATKTRLETVLELHPTKIDGNVACAIFSHLEHPRDRDRARRREQGVQGRGEVGRVFAGLRGV